jgi:hypothetical protein
MELGTKLVLKGKKECLLVEYFRTIRFGKYEFLSSVVLYETGVRCGYIGIPKEYKITDEDIDKIECHGGITYNQRYSTFIKANAEEALNLRWIGYDCAHNQDMLDIEKVKKIWPKSPYIQVENQMVFPWNNSRELRTTEFCAQENLSIIAQLIDLLDQR